METRLKKRGNFSGGVKTTKTRLTRKDGIGTKHRHRPSESYSKDRDKEGYGLILEKDENIVLFGTKSIDLTDRVIKAYDLQKK
jgi:hypothetical protein